MTNARPFLIVSLLFVLLLMWQAWQQDYGPKPLTTPPPAEQTTPAEVPPPPATTAAEEPATPVSAAPALRPQGRRVRVTTDVLAAEFDTAGADLRVLDLLRYPQTLAPGAPPVRLLDEHTERFLILQTGLRGEGGAPAPDDTALYSTAATEYRLADGQDVLEVVFSWDGGNGIRVEKVYTFRRGEYVVELTFRVVNESGTPWRAAPFAQLQQRYVPVERSILDPESFTYTGGVWHDGTKYHQAPFAELEKQGLDRTLTGGWAGLVQHYFLAALLPPAGETNRYYADALGGGRYRVGYVGSVHEVAPGARAEVPLRLFLGPKLQDRLEDVAPGLERTVDYGLMTVIAEPLFAALAFIHRLVGNWGWAIVILTVLIKALFYKLSEVSGRSLAKMRKITPRLQALKERYQDDRARLNQAMLELYQKEKINPAAGCLPILVQIPVFIALYWVLLNSVELRQAPWLLWIDDLSARDPYFVLPLLMGIAMYVQQKLNPQPPDPVQARIMMAMPLVMVVFSAFFPAGLTLYWLVNTALSALQQWHINRVLEREGHR